MFKFCIMFYKVLGAQMKGVSIIYYFQTNICSSAGSVVYELFSLVFFTVIHERNTHIDMQTNFRIISEYGCGCFNLYNEILAIRRRYSLVNV